MSQANIWNHVFERGAPGESDDWISRYEAYLSGARSGNLLDLGCGGGENALRLSARGFHVLACDVSDVALARLRERCASIATYCFDMARLPWPIEAGGIGVVLASLSTHYFTAADTQAVYDAIYGVLQPGGHLIFRVNDAREYERHRADVVEELEAGYYRMRGGFTRRFFDMDAVRRLLARFELIELNQAESEYHGHRKYFIEGVARKQ